MTPDLFWNKVDKSGECWIWIGSKVGGTEYGKVGYAGKTWRAHRLSWKFAFGDIPNDLCVLHKCDNPSCVRPDHLFLGTHDDNNKDMVKKGRSVKGDKNPRRLYPERYPTGDNHYSRKEPHRLARGDRHGLRLHPERRPTGEKHGSHTHPEKVRRGASHHNAAFTEQDVREIYRLCQAKSISYSDLAVFYNVSASTIERIAKGKTWKHVTSEVLP